jgi:zinc protease
MPTRGTKEWFAMGVLDQILLRGQDSRMFQKLVRETGIAGGVHGGINVGLGNMYPFK